jgi:hypothetical protein
MQKYLVSIIILLAVAAAGLWYVFQPRPEPTTHKPKDIASMEFRELFALASECEAGKIEEHCTMIIEIMALKSQHARQGERFWMEQMGRLGEWYTRVGEATYKLGGEEPPEFAKANEVFDWVLKTKPFHGDRSLLGKARIHEITGRTEMARASYERLQERFPDSKYAAQVTEALLRVR